jgi:hypothetical protein
MSRWRVHHVLSLCVAAALSLPVLAEDWPQFRGPGGLGISQAQGLPVTWSELENVAWKTALPGAGASSPIALGGKLYVTCFSGFGMPAQTGTQADLTLHLVCVDGATGKILWDSKTKPSLPGMEKVRDHGYASQTPATDGRHLYVFFGKSGVIKFDLDGKPLWRTPVGEGTHKWGSATSPVLYQNRVIVNASVESKSLVALDTDTGQEVWRAGGMEAAWNTPHLVQTPEGKTELAVSVKGWILGFDPATGQELWRCEGIPDYVCPSLVSHEGILYAIGGRESKAIAVRSGGRGDVTGTHRLWQAAVGANVCSPVVQAGFLYWVSDRNQTAYCLNVADGTVSYAEKIESAPYASVLSADGRLYVVTRTGGTLVLAAKPQFERLAVNRLADPSTFNACPIVMDRSLILRSEANLYCIRKAD